MSLYLSRDDKMPYQKAFSENSTTTGGFTAKAPTTTEPIGTGVVLCERPGGGAPVNVFIVPFGSDANNEAFALRLIGWRNIGTLWIPARIGEWTITLGNIAVSDLGTNNFIADTIVAVDDRPEVQPYSPANDHPGSITTPVFGFTKLEFLVNRDSAASGNALYSFY